MGDRPENQQPNGEAFIASDSRFGQPLQIYDTENLFGSGSEIGISHGGSLYKLKITRQGKLVLNK